MRQTYEDGFADGHGEGIALLLQPMKDLATIARLKWGNLEPAANTIMASAESAIAEAEAFAPGAKPSPALAAVLDGMLAYEAEAFDGPPETDLQVSGADLVDAFTEWRGQIREALAGGRVPVDVRAQALDALRTALAYVDGVSEDQISGEEEGIYDDETVLPEIQAAQVKIEAAIKALG